MIRAKVTTLRSPREAMMMLARAWRPLFNDINSHYRVDNRGKVILDKKTVEDIGIFSSLNQKLKDAFMQQLLNDARVIGEEAKRKKDYKMAESLLKEIESLLKSLKRSQLIAKRQAGYLRRLAISLGGNVKKIEREVGREGIRAEKELKKTFIKMGIKKEPAKDIYRKAIKSKPGGQLPILFK